VLSQKKILFPFLFFPFCHLILDIMDYFLAGKDQQQTKQLNDLAGG